MGVQEVYNEADYDEFMLVQGIFNIQGLPDFDGNFLKNGIAYQQTEVSKSSCGIHAGLTIVSNMINKTYDVEIRREVWELAKEEYGAKEGTGMWIYKGADCVRNWYNSQVEDNEKISTFSIKVDSEEFWTLLKKGYMCQTGYYGDFTYTKDKNDDGNVNTIEDTKKTFGHSISYYNKEKGKIVLGAVDNYSETSPHNEYEIDQFKKLVENGVIFKKCYFYIPSIYVQLAEVEIPKHIELDEVEDNERGIILDWRNKMRIAIMKGYDNEFKDYYQGSPRVILMKMITDIKDIKKTFTL